MTSKKIKNKKNVFTFIFGAIFAKSTHIHQFCEGLQIFCPNFLTFFPDFHQIKIFCTLPLTPVVRIATNGMCAQNNTHVLWRGNSPHTRLNSQQQ